MKTLLLSLVVVTLLAGACAVSPVQPPVPGKPATSQTLPATAPDQATPPALGHAASPASAQERLPEPIITGNPVEICLNSRYSEHGLTGKAGDQQIGNILWAAGRAPVTGTYRNIYVATPTGEYAYDAGTHSLSRHSDQNVSSYKNFFSMTADGAAFVINGDSNLTFDTGVAYQLAILASVSLWKSGVPAVANCPVMTSLQFGVQEVRGLTSRLAVHSSAAQGDPSWLPDPSTGGTNKLEEMLSNLKYVDKFSPDNLTLQQISQLLWAGYGCTPHMVSGGKQGLTVPSAVARYYLTGTIYLVNEKGVYRYQNRNPVKDMRTADHRIEPINAGDVRNKMGTAVSGLPKAPCYIVLCLPKTNSLISQDRDFALLETGFVAGNVLVQASAMGLGCNFETALRPDEQAGIRGITGIPASDTPQAIICLGGAPK